MLQRITDLWPSLYRRIDPPDNDAEEPLLAAQEEEEGDGRAHAVDEDKLLFDYHNLFWSRLMKIQDYEAGQDRKWPLGPDIVEECKAVEALPEVDMNDWVPLFEPVNFNQTHGPLTLE